MPAEEPNPHANVSSAHVSSQVPKDKSVYPDIEELKQHMKEYVDSKFEYLVNLIKANHIEVMNSKSREDGQQPNVMYCVCVFSLCVIIFIGHYVTNSFNKGYGRQVYTAHG